ncbi:hypothetical protein FRB96_000943 [Tulasnella sp. 330]|nr:hypothetical protein FRB96_000943 [Tulasnella sp. 330]KAG8872328.1 hypothetical protein FRB97_007758 [Tulasnella sp. 331]KAG8875556.1 hypothetical protein FRB98_007742 [Tulasnella sp. 332]
MFLLSISTLLLLAAATHSVLALPVEDSSIEERSTHCHTILKGHLVGFDSRQKQFTFVTNSANEVAYDHDWKKSKHQLYVHFQQCPKSKDPIGDEDSTGFVGRMYVPALNGCISSPAYLQSTSAKANYYPVIKPCDATTRSVAEDALWKYYPDEVSEDSNSVYWSAQPNRLQKHCDGLYGYKTNSRSDQLPYTRPGHHGAIEFHCHKKASENRFFVQ